MATQLEPGDRVSWRVNQYAGPPADPHRSKTFYGTVVRAEDGNLWNGISWSQLQQEPGAVVLPDAVEGASRPRERWIPLRHLSDQHGYLTN